MEISKRVDCESRLASNGDGKLFPVGEVSVEIELENAGDVLARHEGNLGSRKFRHHKMSAVVDTGAVMLALPQDVAESLGLQMVRKAIVSYADDRRDELDVAAPVKIRIGDRHMTTECLVLPPMSEALIGQVVLETLDLIVDCQRQTLTPRPESPIYPSLKLK